MARAMLTLALVCGGCATSLRLGAAPTLDSRGHAGALLTVTAALGESYRHGAAAVLASADLSGAVDGTPAGHVGLGLGLDALGESPRFGFRIGATLAGRAILPSGAAGGAVGGRIGLLPVVAYRHRGRPPERCGESESWTFWHVGVELLGQYLWGSDARGLFAAGPVFEVDSLLDARCD